MSIDLSFALACNRELETVRLASRQYSVIAAFKKLESLDSVRTRVLAISVILVSLLLLSAVARADDPSAWSREKKRVYAETIVARLASASGEARTPPRVRVSKRVSVAVYWPDQGVIELDERTFDLCANGPVNFDDALAILLGHELAHFYANHGWLREYGNELKPSDFANELKRLSEEERLAAETEADYFGSFTAYLAGFDPVGAAPKLLAAIYKIYAKMPGYPSVEQRVALAEASDARLRQLIPVFEAGNLLVALRQYESAALCFDRIAQDFPSREILNNAGVARAMLAVSLLPADDAKFAYPFELDTDTRLRRPPVASRGDDDEPARERRERLLREAQTRFEQAIARDSDYATAYVNLAAVYALRGEARLAEAFAEKGARLAEAQARPITLAGSRIVQAIVAAQAEDVDRAADLLARATASPELADANLIAIGRKPALQAVRAPASEAPVETMSGISAESADLFASPPHETVHIRSVRASEPDLAITTKLTDDWTAYRIELPTAQWIILSTTTAETRDKIKVGSTAKQVDQAYGPPDSVATSRGGTLHVYADRKLIIEYSAEGIVVRWHAYALRAR